MIFSTNSDVLFIEGRRRNSAQENWKSCVNKNKAKNHMPTHLKQMIKYVQTLTQPLLKANK